MWERIKNRSRKGRLSRPRILELEMVKDELLAALGLSPQSRRREGRAVVARNGSRVVSGAKGTSRNGCCRRL